MDIETRTAPVHVLLLVTVDRRDRKGGGLPSAEGLRSCWYVKAVVSLGFRYGLERLIR